MTGNNLTDVSVDALVKILTTSRELRELHVDSNDFTAKAKPAIARAVAAHQTLQKIL